MTGRNCRVLLLGLTPSVVEDAALQLDATSVEVLTGSGVEEVRTALAGGRIDAAILGSGLEFEARLELAREIFSRSDVTTVHLKDHASGPDGYAPFVRKVVEALKPE